MSREAWDAPDNSTECQDHLEVMNQQDIETELEDGVVAGSVHVLCETAGVDEDRESAEQDIEGLLVARVWAIDPPEAEDADDEGGQHGQLP